MHFASSQDDHVVDSFVPDQTPTGQGTDKQQEIALSARQRKEITGISSKLIRRREMDITCAAVKISFFHCFLLSVNNFPFSDCHPAPPGPGQACPPWVDGRCHDLPPPPPPTPILLLPRPLFGRICWQKWGHDVACQGQVYHNGLHGSRLCTFPGSSSASPNFPLGCFAMRRFKSSRLDSAGLGLRHMLGSVQPCPC